MKKIFSVLLFLLAAITSEAVPGNIFIEGEFVSIPIPEKITDFKIRDIDGNLCFPDCSANTDRIDLGVVPVGSYRIEYRLADKKLQIDSLTVLPRPPEKLNLNSPIAVDAALFYPFFLRSVGRLKFDYSPDDVISLLRKAGISTVRERIMWSDFDYLRPQSITNSTVDNLMAAYRQYGIKVVPTLYGTPQPYRYPTALSFVGNKKPPLDLSLLHRYVKQLTLRFGDVCPAIETWNEPEGIGGEMLSFEIAAAQKAAMLGAYQANSMQICFMGNGGMHYPQNLLANQLNDYQNVFCHHNHASLTKTRELALKYLPCANTLPVWLTEVSTGSFMIDPATGEFSPETARRQALDIPKVNAVLLAAGADKLFYFFLFYHTEIGGRSFGLLRTRDLMPRPGFATLAVMANYLQNLHSIEPLANLPKNVTGYQIYTIWNGKPYAIQLLWSSKAQKIQLADMEFIRDAFGRRVNTEGNSVSIAEMPLYCFKQLAALPEKPSSIKIPKPATPPSPVVLNLELPDNIKNNAGDTFQIPVEQKSIHTLAIYNFSQAPIRGSISVEFPDGDADPFQLKDIDVPADSRLERPLVLELKRIGSGVSASRLILRGDFGAAGMSSLTARFIPVRSVKPGDMETPVANWKSPALWKKYIIKESDMNISSSNGEIIFDYRFGKAENRVINHVWGSPTLPLNVRDFPEYLPDALAFDLRLLRGNELETIGLNLVESDGATYFSSLPYQQDSLRKGQTFVVPLATMINPHFRKKDTNNKLDVDKLRALELPVWAKPNSHITLAVKNLRWINYKEKKNGRKFLPLGNAKVVNIPNSDFTQARADGTPTRWGVSGTKPGFSAEIDDGTLKLTTTSKVKWASVYITPADIKILPALKTDESWQLEFCYRQKNENMKGVAFGTIEIRNAQHRRLLHKDGISLPPNTDWESRRVVLKIKKLPEEAQYILLSFFFTGDSGTTRFDDAKLTVFVQPDAGD